MPVSTFRCTAARHPSRERHRRDRVDAGGVGDGQVDVGSGAASICSASSAWLSLRIGKVTPPARSASASGTVATPSQSAAPVAWSIEATSGAP